MNKAVVFVVQPVSSRAVLSLFAANHGQYTQTLVDREYPFTETHTLSYIWYRRSILLSIFKPNVLAIQLH